MVTRFYLKKAFRHSSSFSALTLLVGSFDPYKLVPDMTYNVFGGTLNLALSIYQTYRTLTFSYPAFRTLGVSNPALNTNI